MKKRTLFIIFFITLIPWVISYSYAEEDNPRGIKCPAYGHYWTDNKYGAKREVKTPDEAKQILEKFFIPHCGMQVYIIRNDNRFFEAKILNIQGVVVDMVIIDKSSGRIRSVY
jgi:hypothetical protein